MSVHPCGMCMDFIRAGYRAEMRTFHGGTTVPVVWFRVPVTTPIFEEPTVFRSRNWCDPKFNDGIGEQRGYDDECVWPPTFYNGKPPAKYAGEEVCGPLIAWLEGGVFGRDPEILTDSQGRCPDCAQVEEEEPDSVGDGGFGVGRPATAFTSTTDVGTGGVAAGGEATSFATTPDVAEGGVSTGGEATAFATTADAGTGGVATGGEATDFTPEHSSGDGGPGLGGEAWSDSLFSTGDGGPAVGGDAFSGSLFSAGDGGPAVGGQAFEVVLSVGDGGPAVGGDSPGACRDGDYPTFVGGTPGSISPEACILPIPAGAVMGDTVVVVAWVTDDYAGYSPPLGYVPFVDVNLGIPSRRMIAWYLHYPLSAPPDSITITTDPMGSPILAALFVLRDTISPSGVYVSTGLTPPAVLPAGTVHDRCTLVVRVAVDGPAPGTLTAPEGYTAWTDVDPTVEIAIWYREGVPPSDLPSIDLAYDNLEPWGTMTLVFYQPFLP